MRMFTGSQLHSPIENHDAKLGVFYNTRRRRHTEEVDGKARQALDEAMHWTLVNGPFAIFKRSLIVD